MAVYQCCYAETDAYAQGRWNNAFRFQRHISTNQCQIRAACFSVCRVRRRKEGEKQQVGVRPNQSGFPRCRDQNLRSRLGGIPGSHPGGTSSRPECPGRIGAGGGTTGAAAKAAAGTKDANATAIPRGERGCLICNTAERLQTGDDSQESAPVFFVKSQAPSESVGRWSSLFVPSPKV